MKESFFDAVRGDDIDEARRLLAAQPSLIHARWPGRGSPDGKMRSLGPPPFNQHTWFPAPVNPGDPNAPRYTSMPLIYSRDDGMVQMLVESGADVNARGTSGEIELRDWFYTPLWRAAHDGRLASVRLLVEHGADVNVVNPDGCNQALKTAAENGRLEVCAYLLANGALPDIHNAAMLGLVDAVERLLDANATLVHHRDSHGRTPLHCATLMDTFRIPIPQTDEHDLVAQILIANGAVMDLGHAASLGDAETVRHMLTSDPELVNWKRHDKPLITGSADLETPMQAAVRRECSEVAAVLREFGVE